MMPGHPGIGDHNVARRIAAGRYEGPGGKLRSAPWVRTTSGAADPERDFPIPGR